MLINDIAKSVSKRLNKSYPNILGKVIAGAITLHNIKHCQIISDTVFGLMTVIIIHSNNRKPAEAKSR